MYKMFVSKYVLNCGRPMLVRSWATPGTFVGVGNGRCVEEVGERVEGRARGGRSDPALFDNIGYLS